jgi:hypothetical protein
MGRVRGLVLAALLTTVVAFGPQLTQAAEDVCSDERLSLSSRVIQWCGSLTCVPAGWRLRGTIVRWP